MLNDRDRGFLLGTFAANCSGGMAVTSLPERWENSWANNLSMAKTADDAGIDFLLPIARYIGYGGTTDFHGNVLDPMCWASALLASTARISVFATVHAAFQHPAVVAKQIATLDAIAPGRAGLNIVAGWNKPEYDALGISLPVEHEPRYAHAQEWFDVIERVWTKAAAFDHHGRFFDLTGLYGAPRPAARPPILNAAGSNEGREFAVRNADFLFTPAIDLDRSREEVAQLKMQASNAGRAVDVLTFSTVVCRPTEAEAQQWLQHYARDHVDDGALDNLIALQFAHAQSFPHDLMALIRDRFAAGHGGFPLVGTPEQVADGIVALHDAGFAGTTLAFVDYAQELPYFCETVLPLLKERGLRN